MATFSLKPLVCSSLSIYVSQKCMSCRNGAFALPNAERTWILSTLGEIGGIDRTHMHATPFCHIRERLPSSSSLPSKNSSAHNSKSIFTYLMLLFSVWFEHNITCRSSLCCRFHKNLNTNTIKSDSPYSHSHKFIQRARQLIIIIRNVSFQSNRV